MKKLEENIIICERDFDFLKGVVWRVCVMLLLKLSYFAAVSYSQLYLYCKFTKCATFWMTFSMPAFFLE